MEKPRPLAPVLYALRSHAQHSPEVCSQGTKAACKFMRRQLALVADLSIFIGGLTGNSDFRINFWSWRRHV
jgi:hypothetical protein